MSSWNAYVDKMMDITGVSSAGIYGINGQKWASTTDFPLTSSDVQLLVAGIHNIASLEHGITVKNERYIPIQSDGEQFCCLKKNLNGIVAYKANKCVLIVIHNDTVKFEQVCPHVGVLRDYLFNSGY